MHKRSLILAALVTAVISHTAYAAAYQTETEVINHVGIGDISIGLEEYELDEAGEEIPYRDGKTVLPGQRVDKIVRITNKANTAWIRAKLEYLAEDSIEGLSDEMVSLASDQWIWAGGYYYYLSPVEKDGRIDFIKEVRIPSEWDSSVGGKRFSIIITAEAVQTEHFTPDFASEDPWFGTVIETCIHTSYETDKVSRQNFSIAFEGGAEGLVKIGEDFFSNWGELMPGDVVSDTVTVRNNYRCTVMIDFHTETIADDPLLETVWLEIRNSDQILYSGSLKGAVANKINLASLKNGEETILTYTLQVPENLNNQYGLNKTKTKWIFSAKLNHSGGGGSSGGGSSSPGEEPTAFQPSVETEAQPVNQESEVSEPEIASRSNLAETGDNNSFGLLLFSMAVSACGFAAVYLKKRRGEASDHENEADHTWQI